MLCLSEPKQNNHVVVCNPISGEFIKLPQASEVENYGEKLDSGLGYCLRTNSHDHLCTCDASEFGCIRRWVMKNYGAGESWTEVSINTENDLRTYMY